MPGPTFRHLFMDRRRRYKVCDICVCKFERLSVASGALRLVTNEEYILHEVQ